MKKGPGLRTTLVTMTYQSFLYGYSQGNFYNASRLLKALSRLVGVKLPETPMRSPKQSILVNHQPWETYCSDHLDTVMVGVDKYLKRHGNVSSVRLWTEEDERREREELEESEE